jgi:hypothetical protein
LAALGSAVMNLHSCVLANNVAVVLGGGIHAAGATATLENVTWNANQANLGGADAVYASGCPSPWIVRNSLVSNHSIATNPALLFTGAAPQLDYNIYFNNAGGNVSGGSPGANDLTVNPLYVDAANGDVALGLHSPGLDSGDPAVPLHDPDGSRNDRGAYGGPQAISRAPAPPTGLQVLRLTSPNRNALSWNASPAPDASFFAVYRGATSNFVPSAANYLGQVAAATPAFSDFAGSATDWYRIGVVDQSGAASGFSIAVQPSATDVPPVVPDRWALHPNQPNPFNPTTVLRYDLVQSASVRLVVYDPAGRIVIRLVDGVRPAGSHTATWDGRDQSGHAVGSGVYIARLETDSFAATRKMILVR